MWEDGACMYRLGYTLTLWGRKTKWSPRVGQGHVQRSHPQGSVRHSRQPEQIVWARPAGPHSPSRA